MEQPQQNSNPFHINNLLKDYIEDIQRRCEEQGITIGELIQRDKDLAEMGFTDHLKAIFGVISIDSIKRTITEAKTLYEEDPTKFWIIIGSGTAAGIVLGMILDWIF